MTGNELSGLETPTYISMSVLAAFILLSIVIEKIVHCTEKFLSKRKRLGLKAAFDIMVQELMLLGFMSLLLTVVEEPLAKICVHEKHYRSTWIMMNRIPDCDSCVSQTRRLGDTEKWNKRCAAWGELTDDPHLGEQMDSEHEVDHSEHGVDHSDHRRLLSDHGSHHGHCDEGEIQLVSHKTLHEVHTAIFLISVLHALSIMLMVLLASLRIKYYQGGKKKKSEDSSESLESGTHATLVTPSAAPLLDGNPDSTLSTPNNGSLPMAGREENNSRDYHTKNLLETVKEYADISDTELEDSTDESNTAPTMIPAITRQVTRMLSQRMPNSPMQPYQPNPENVVPQVSPFDETDTSRIGFLMEWAWCLLKALCRPVTRKQFQIMKEAFTTHHNVGKLFIFEEYLDLSFDDDIRKIVKIPVTGWAFLASYALLVAPMQFSALLLLAVIVILDLTVLIVCGKLTKIVRCVTKDGMRHSLTPEYFWFKDPKTLLPIVRFALFANSSVFATMLFFLWQYGGESCAVMGKADGRSFLHQSAGVLILIINTHCFFHISLVLLPLYSIVVHMGSDHWSKHLVPAKVRTRVNELLKNIRKAPKTHAPNGTRAPTHH